MKLYQDVKIALPLVIGLVCLKSNNWQKEIAAWLRFILCGMFFYLAYTIFSQLGPLMIGKEDRLISLGFENPSYFILALIALFFGYFGLLCSIVAGALYASLLPKT